MEFYGGMTVMEYCLGAHYIASCYHCDHAYYTTDLEEIQQLAYGWKHKYVAKTFLLCSTDLLCMKSLQDVIPGTWPDTRKVDS